MKSYCVLTNYMTSRNFRSNNELRAHLIIILPFIDKLMILEDGERMLRVLFVVKSERM